jgi:hypothetical protein
MQLVSPSAVLKVTETKSLLIGKPDPVIVRVSPPSAFASDGKTESTASRMVMSGMLATGTRPFESRTSTL